MIHTKRHKERAGNEVLSTTTVNFEYYAYHFVVSLFAFLNVYRQIKHQIDQVDLIKLSGGTNKEKIGQDSSNSIN